MYCRSCDTPREPAHPGPIWGADRISGLRCARCGALLGADDVVRLLLAKQSQLEQFGMLTPPSEAPAPPRAMHILRLEKD